LILEVLLLELILGATKGMDFVGKWYRFPFFLDTPKMGDFDTLWLLKMAIEIVSFPIKNGDFP
jgi:hypothetical protein